MVVSPQNEINLQNAYWQIQLREENHYRCGVSTYVTIRPLRTITYCDVTARDQYSRVIDAVLGPQIGPFPYPKSKSFSFHSEILRTNGSLESNRLLKERLIKALNHQSKCETVRLGAVIEFGTRLIQSSL